MMKITRRSLFKGAISVSAVAAIPALLAKEFSEKKPIFYDLPETPPTIMRRVHVDNELIGVDLRPSSTGYHCCIGGHRKEVVCPGTLVIKGNWSYKSDIVDLACDFHAYDDGQGKIICGQVSDPYDPADYQCGTIDYKLGTLSLNRPRGSVAAWNITGSLRPDTIRYSHLGLTGDLYASYDKVVQHNVLHSKIEIDEDRKGPLVGKRAKNNLETTNYL